MKRHYRPLFQTLMFEIWNTVEITLFLHLEFTYELATSITKYQFTAGMKNPVVMIVTHCVNSAFHVGN